MYSGVHGTSFACVRSGKHKSDVNALLAITCTAPYCCFVVLQTLILHVVGKVPGCIGGYTSMLLCNITCMIFIFYCCFIYIVLCVYQGKVYCNSIFPILYVLYVCITRVELGWFPMYAVTYMLISIPEVLSLPVMNFYTRYELCLE